MLDRIVPMRLIDRFLTWFRFRTVHAPAAGKLRIRDLLRYRDYTRYAFARFLGSIAWQMLGVAVGWQVYSLTHNPLDLAWVGLAQFLPFLGLVLPAGHLADRVDRRLVLVGAYIVEALCSVILLWFTLSGAKFVWPVFVAMALLGTARAFWMPTGQAMTVNLVPPEVFPKAIGFNTTLFQVAVISGPAFGGILYAYAERGLHVSGALLVYGSSLVLLVIVIFLIGGIRPVTAARVHAEAGWREASEGLRFVWRRRPLLGAISLDLFAVLFGGATALLPIYAADILRVGPIGLGVLRSAPGVGAGMGALLLALTPIERRAGEWMFGGVALFGLATVVFGVSTSFWLSLIALVAMGVGDVVSVFVRQLLVQLETPDAIRGRVSAVNAMFVGASNELGEFESGVTARWWGAVPAVVVGGAACLIVVAAYLWLFPELRRLDRFPKQLEKAQ